MRGNRAAARIARIESAWGVRLPEAFTRLAKAGDENETPDLVILSIRQMDEMELVQDGQPPWFLPIALDEEDIIGLRTDASVQGEPPVIRWQSETDHYVPAGSSFACFLMLRALEGQLDDVDELDPSSPEATANHRKRREVLTTAGLNPEILVTMPAATESEFLEAAHAIDPADPFVRCQQAARLLAAGEARASLQVVAPARECGWFSDPHYIAAEAHLAAGDIAEAVAGWWAVISHQAYNATSTEQYDLGTTAEEGDIYLLARNRLRAHRDHMPQSWIRSPLGLLVLEGDEFDSEAHFALGTELREAGDLDGAREALLSALGLAIEDKPTARAYAELASLYDERKQPALAAICRTILEEL